MLKRNFTAIYQKRGSHYIAWVEEIPGVNTQGKTKRDTKENLKEALELILSANRDISHRQSSSIFEREQIQVAVPA